LFLYSVIFVHKLDIVRKKYIVYLQIYSAAKYYNRSTCDRETTKKRKGWTYYWDTV